MADDVVKVPIVNLEIPRPKPWDLVALIGVVLGLGAIAANLAMSGLAEPGRPVSTPLSVAFVILHLAICLGSLMLLGKTVKEGTIHGNLLSVAGVFIGLGGAMLAAAIWAAA